MDGVINLVTVNAAGNVTTLGGTTNYTQLEAALDPAFQPSYGCARSAGACYVRWWCCAGVLHNIFRLNSTYFIEGDTTSWGLQFDSFKIPRGRYNIVEHSLLNAFGSSSSWAKMAIALTLSRFNLAYMQGRKTQLTGNLTRRVSRLLITVLTLLVVRCLRKLPALLRTRPPTPFSITSLPLLSANLGV
jgi:hypothetical protein